LKKKTHQKARNPGIGLGQAQKSGEVKLVKGIVTLSS